MPIFLEAPGQRPRGPDGKGWNRLRLDVMDPLPQCALKPLNITALAGSQNTFRASWGNGYGICTTKGQCTECPIYKERPVSPRVPVIDADDFYIREGPDGEPHAMHKMERGFGEYSLWGFSWSDVSRWPGFYPAKFGRDEHSRWVHMRRIEVQAAKKAA